MNIVKPKSKSILYLPRNSVILCWGSHGECVLDPDTGVAHQPGGQVGQGGLVQAITEAIVNLIRPHAEVRVLQLSIVRTSFVFAIERLQQQQHTTDVLKIIPDISIVDCWFVKKYHKN